MRSFILINNYSTITTTTTTFINNNTDNDNKIIDSIEEKPILSTTKTTATTATTTSSVYGVKKPKPRRKIMKLGLNRPIIKAQIERNNKLEEDAKIHQLPWRIMGST